MSDENMIDYSNCIFILEDIIDTFPIKDMEILFDILENSLKSQLSKSIVKNYYLIYTVYQFYVSFTYNK